MFCLISDLVTINTMAQSADTSFIPDLPKGPLCVYRKRAKFDWKRLRLIFEKEQALRIKVDGIF